MQIKGSNMLSFVAVLVMLAKAQSYTSPADIYMGTAANYGVIGSSEVNNVGYTTIYGNLAIHPGTSVIGFPPGIITGEENIADAQALQAKNDLEAGSIDAESRAYDQKLNGDAGGLTLAPGVYRSTSELLITGDLKLDCQNSITDPIWIFQIVSKLTLTSGSAVAYVNCLETTNPHAYWNVGSSATLEAGSTIVGTLMAYSSIGAKSQATTGALMARTAAVTLSANQVTTPQYSLTSDPSLNTQSSGSSSGASSQGGKAGIAIACIVVFLAFVGFIYYVTVARAQAVESASGKQNPMTQTPAEKKARFEPVETVDSAEGAADNV